MTQSHSTTENLDWVPKAVIAILSKSRYHFNYRKFKLEYMRQRVQGLVIYVIGSISCSTSFSVHHASPEFNSEYKDKIHLNQIHPWHTLGWPPPPVHHPEVVASSEGAAAVSALSKVGRYSNFELIQIFEFRINS